MCHSAKTDWPFKSCSKSKDSSLWRSPFVEGIHLVIATAFIVAIIIAGVIIIIDCVRNHFCRPTTELGVAEGFRMFVFLRFAEIQYIIKGPCLGKPN